MHPLSRFAKRLSSSRELRRRRPPRLRTAAAADGPPTVYYLCPDYQEPSGGIRVIYRHVDILEQAGIPAAVLHHRTGFAARWFEHSTRVLAAPRVRLSSADLLVVPEIYGPFLERLPREPTLIGFNQNAYLTYQHMKSGRLPAYDRFAAALTVSPDSAEYLRFAFPDLEVSVVGNAIDGERFHPAAGPPPRRLALLPGKRPREADELLRLLGERLSGWEVVRIEGASEQEVAAALRGAPIFVALGLREGFGLPAAEAMASGCFVVGFPGFGGRDLFAADCSRAVEDGDVLTLAREVAAAMGRYEREPEAVREAGARAARRTLEICSPRRQREELLSFYRKHAPGAAVD
ncbi:MAG TPA: glycosyltransferase [Solirubrobacterales bacterium]|nr:glycosyltransferase [Solirubrobacterales bacterium]